MSSIPVYDPEVGLVDISVDLVVFTVGDTGAEPLLSTARDLGATDPVVARLLRDVQPWLYGRAPSREFPHAQEYDRLAPDVTRRLAAVRPSREGHLDLIDWALIEVARLEPARAAAAGVANPPKWSARWVIRKGGVDYPQRQAPTPVCTPTEWRECVERAREAGPRLMEIRRRARAARTDDDVARWAATALLEVLTVVRATRARQGDLFALLDRVADACGPSEAELPAARPCAPR